MRTSIGEAMKIIIVGCGNVGATLAEQLSKEKHDITVIDTRQQAVEAVTNVCDVMGIIGNGASFNAQTDAGIADADLMIAVTGSDELNLLCCLIAKKAGGCHTIARVSNPVYSREIGFIKEEFPVLPNYSELGYGIGSDLFHIALFLGFEKFKYQSVGLKFALELFR